MKKKDGKQKYPNGKQPSDDYLYTNLAVLSQAGSPPGECPDPETLAAFLENGLTGKQRRVILAHLNECSICRHHLELIQSTGGEIPLQQSNWIHAIINRIKSIKPNQAFAGGGFGLALAACLLIVFLSPSESRLNRMITETYSALPASDIARYNAYTAKGVNEDQTTPLPNDLAGFKAGMAYGKSILLSKQLPDTDKNTKAPYSLFFSFGQWAVILQCTCISTGPASEPFWSKQSVIAEQFIKDADELAGYGTNVQHIRKSVNAIDSAIQEILATGASADGCEEIQDAIATLEIRIGIN